MSPKKGQAIADHLAEHPLPDYEPLKTHFPDEDILCLEEEEKPDERDDAWTMYFDGAANNKGSGVGAILLSPDGAHVSVSKKLAFGSTNNVAQYEACIAGLKEALSLVNLNWNCATFRIVVLTKSSPRTRTFQECQFEERASFGPTCLGSCEWAQEIHDLRFE